MYSNLSRIDISYLKEINLQVLVDITGQGVCTQLISRYGDFDKFNILIIFLDQMIEPNV